MVPPIVLEACQSLDKFTGSTTPQPHQASLFAQEVFLLSPTHRSSYPKISLELPLRITKKDMRKRPFTIPSRSVQSFTLDPLADIMQNKCSLNSDVLL